MHGYYTDRGALAWSLAPARRYARRIQLVVATPVQWRKYSTLWSVSAGRSSRVLSGVGVEGVRDRGELAGIVSGQVSALRKILAE